MHNNPFYNWVAVTMYSHCDSDSEIAEYSDFCDSMIDTILFPVGLTLLIIARWIGKWNRLYRGRARASVRFPPSVLHKIFNFILHTSEISPEFNYRRQYTRHMHQPTNTADTETCDLHILLISELNQKSSCVCNDNPGLRANLFRLLG